MKLKTGKFKKDSGNNFKYSGNNFKYSGNNFKFYIINKNKKMLKVNLQQIILKVLVANLIFQMVWVYVLYERLIKAREKLAKYSSWYWEQKNREKMINRIVKDVK